MAWKRGRNSDRSDRTPSRGLQIQLHCYEPTLHRITNTCSASCLFTSTIAVIHATNSTVPDLADRYIASMVCTVRSLYSPDCRSSPCEWLELRGILKNSKPFKSESTMLGKSTDEVQSSTDTQHRSTPTRLLESIRTRLQISTESCRDALIIGPTFLSD